MGLSTALVAACLPGVVEAVEAMEVLKLIEVVEVVELLEVELQVAAPEGHTAE